MSVFASRWPVASALASAYLRHSRLTRTNLRMRAWFDSASASAIVSSRFQVPPIDRSTGRLLVFLARRALVDWYGQQALFNLATNCCAIRPGLTLGLRGSTQFAVKLQATEGREVIHEARRSEMVCTGVSWRVLCVSLDTAQFKARWGGTCRSLSCMRGDRWASAPASGIGWDDE